MKKRWKIFWTACGITAAVGITCCVAALALGVTAEMIEARFPNGFGLISGGEEVSSRESYTGVHKIDMDLSVGDVEVLPTQGREVIVETEGISRRLGLSSRTEEDELKITSRKLSLFRSYAGKGKIYIYLPKGENMEEVSLEIGAGNLTLQGLLAEKISLSVGAGSGRAENFFAREAEFDCGTGRITAQGYVSRELELNCGMGEIAYIASGAEDDYNYEVKCGVGEVVIGDDEYSGLGRSRNINNGADCKIDIDCGVGRVSVDFAGTGSADCPAGTQERHRNHQF